MSLVISILVVAGAIAVFMTGIMLINKSDKDHHEALGCALMTIGVVVMVLSLDSTLLVTLKSCVTPMGQAAVYRAPDAVLADTTSKKITWDYPSDAHNVVWVVISVDYLNDKPVPRESFAVMTGSFGNAPTEFTLPKNMDMETVETITVFYGNTKGPSGESVIVVNEPPSLPASPAVPPSGSPAAGSAVPGTGVPPAPAAGTSSI
jgi:hypothetical protein